MYTQISELKIAKYTKTADDKVIKKFKKDIVFLGAMLNEVSKTYSSFKNKYDKYDELNEYSDELKAIMKNIVYPIQELKKLNDKMETD